MKEYKGGRPYYGYSVGVLMLDMESPLIPGNVGNAMSDDFPVLYKVLEGLPADWWCDEIGPDETMEEVVDTAVLLEKVEGEEEVIRMDALLSLAVTGGDYNWI